MALRAFQCDASIEPMPLAFSPALVHPGHEAHVNRMSQKKTECWKDPALGLGLLQSLRWSCSPIAALQSTGARARVAMNVGQPVQAVLPTPSPQALHLRWDLRWRRWRLGRRRRRPGRACRRGRDRLQLCWHRQLCLLWLPARGEGRRRLRYRCCCQVCRHIRLWNGTYRERLRTAESRQWQA